MNREIEKILPLVQKPARYTGGELNSVVKNKDDVDIRFAFCFPDNYEVGMSHLGIKILYSLINERKDAWCERVFAPWEDMEKEMRDRKIPLFGLESGDYIKDFDVIGFTLMYEMCYTNVLNMLDLAGVPLRSKDRTSLAPLVIAGGTCACNSEPMAEFFDIVQLGEGEEMMNDLLDLLKECKKNGTAKKDFLIMASKIPGIYVPSLYEVEYNEDNTVKSVNATCGAPQKVTKRIVGDLDKCYYPDKFVVPFIDIVFDRATVEIFRGCIRGCRFCQAGFVYRPIREKNTDLINKQCRALIESTGYDEISLCSLSSSDYTRLPELLNKMLDWTIPGSVNIALPSLRIDNFPDDLVKKLNSVRRSGLTFAPEAGTQRLRDVINKNITENEVLETSRKAFSGGWTNVKLYFMIGLPTENSDDLLGINGLAQKVVDEFYKNPDKPKFKGVNVSVSASSFVPKPFTPFQWEPMNTRDMLAEKQQFIRDTVTTKKVQISFHNIPTSYLEGVFARGDRRLADVIETAWSNGCKFDSWDEFFKFDVWMDAFKKCNIDPDFYVNRKRNFDEIFPWDHMDMGVRKEFLMEENKKAHSEVTTPNCREKCGVCGANKLNGGKCDGMCKTVV